MKRILALICAATSAVALSVATTSATTTSAAAVPSPRGEYCAVEIQPLASDADPAAPVCFATQAEVDAFLLAVTAPRPLARTAASASVVLGTVYKDAGYAGGSLSFYGSGSCSGATFGFASLDAAWRNTISSARAFAGCDVSLYAGASYTGAQLLCSPNCATLGSLNDRVLSLVFRPAV